MILLSTACLLMQRPGAEEFACLSLLIEPRPGPFSALPQCDNHQEFVDTIAQEVTAATDRQTSLLALLAHEVDSRRGSFAKAARMALKLPMQAVGGEGEPVNPGLLGFGGAWMIRAPDDTLPHPVGPGLLSQYHVKRPGCAVRVVLGCRGSFLPCALEPPMQNRRHQIQGQLPPHIQLLDLEVESRQWPTSLVEQALKVALWQAARLDGPGNGQRC